MQDVVERRRRVFGPAHPDTLTDERARADVRTKLAARVDAQAHRRKASPQTGPRLHASAASPSHERFNVTPKKCCNDCGEWLEQDKYSKKQWKARSVRRCLECVAALAAEATG